MDIKELESAVTRLSQAELSRFSEWFEEYLAEKWDRQIETDIFAGRFDDAAKRVDDDFQSGRCTPL